MMVLWWFLDEFTNKAGDPMGVIIQKKDGGYLYTTTDIAAAAYRYHTLHADRVILFTDARQTLHAQQAWLITRKAGFVPDEFVMEHFTFGMMLGKDGKPFKTRTGGTVKLADLLDEAIERATTLIEQKIPILVLKKSVLSLKRLPLVRLNIPTFPKIVTPTMCLIGIICCHLRAILHPICNMPIHAFARFLRVQGLIWQILAVRL